MNTYVEWENETEESLDIGKPTIEEYEKAKEDYKTFSSWVVLARNKKNELIDALALERENELTYTKLMEQKKEIIRRYEIYNEIEGKEKYFTPNEVRQMSPTQVRENYSKIIKSMKHWG